MKSGDKWLDEMLLMKSAVSLIRREIGSTLDCDGGIVIRFVRELTEEEYRQRCKSAKLDIPTGGYLESWTQAPPETFKYEIELVSQ